MVDIFIAPKKNKASSLLIGEHKEKIKKSHSVSAKSTPFGEKVKLLTSFKLKPQGISFRDQADNEEIFLFLRKHLITNVPWIITVFILNILPIFGFVLFNNSFIPFTLPLSYIFVLMAFYYLTIISFAFISFLNWFYNTSLVTDRRIVDIDFSDIIYHNVAITKLDLIEDVDYIQSGFIRSFFNYGDVFIQTAGEKMNFDFLAVPHPEKVIDVIQNLMGGDRDAI
jgi:hypothetical protein